MQLTGRGIVRFIFSMLDNSYGFARTLGSAALIVALGAGCRNTEPVASETAASLPAASAGNETVAHVRWLGRNQVSTRMNSAGLMHLWDDPATAKFQAHVLDRLSTLPWWLATAESARGNPARDPRFQSSTNLLRPLLDDLVLEET